MNSKVATDTTGEGGRTASAMLGHVISDLKANSDIRGALLMDRKGRIIARAMPHEVIFNLGLSELLPRLVEISQNHDSVYRNIMFPHVETEHRGHKILARSIEKGLFLLVLLQESCYMGPAMLDMENSILRIRDILRLHVPQYYQK